MFIVVVTVLVIVITLLFNSLFSLFKIIFTRPLPPTSAVEIDPKNHIYAHPNYTGRLDEPPSTKVKTIYDVLLRGIQVGSNRPQFSFRESSDQKFKSYTYKEVAQITREIGSGILSFGLEPCDKTFFGIYASSSVKYALCLYSAWPYSMVPIGIYDSLGRDGVKFIIKQSGIRLVFADELVRIKNLIEWKDDTVKFEVIIAINEVTEELTKAAEAKNLKLISLDQLRKIGRENLAEIVPPEPSNTAMIMYTSGSTGEPKGCVISHENFVYSMFGMATALDLLDHKDVPRVLNYMPLAHLFGCGTIIALSYLGGEIGFWQGKVDRLVEDFHDFRPTILTMVPRLLNKLYDKVRLELRKKGIVGRILFRLAIRSKLALIRRGDFSQTTIWDKLIFQKIRESFGGKVDRVISSSAPLSPEVCEFSRAAFSCFFVEAYGQTECVIGCAQSINDIESGATGIPTPLNLLKLVDVPEKEYYAKDGVGEICLKSRAVFNGYLYDEAKTNESIDSEGWLHTGDIGRWTPHKTMKIIDRKKNMYKLSQGEYVAPEKIEDVYARSRFIAQVFVYGDSLESCLIGIVLLNDEYVKQWANNEGFTYTKPLSSELSTKLKQVVLDDMAREGKRRGLMSYEQVKAIDFIDEGFTIENGLQTPTFKSRRYAVEKKYKDLFKKIYKTVSA